MAGPVTRDWSPFKVCGPDERAPKMRGMESEDGIRDRLRTAAFAELQAREAFLWAADQFSDVPQELRDAWRGLAGQEQKHLSWLLKRLDALGGTPDEAPVSARLSEALFACASGKEFAILIAKAEERGRLAAEVFREGLAVKDAESSRIFGAIADEEVEHVALAKRYFPGLT